jgi:hypothetical protein
MLECTSHSVWRPCNTVWGVSPSISPKSGDRISKYLGDDMYTQFLEGERVLGRPRPRWMDMELRIAVVGQL